MLFKEIIVVRFQVLTAASMMIPDDGGSTHL
jgi:hypothetical protein